MYGILGIYVHGITAVIIIIIINEGFSGYVKKTVSFRIFPSHGVGGF